MEVKIIEEKKNKIIFEITGQGNTLANVLKEELWNDSNVKAAGYNIAHPLVNTPKFVVETEDSEPRKTVLAAVKRLDKAFDKLKDEVKKVK